MTVLMVFDVCQLPVHQEVTPPSCNDKRFTLASLGCISTVSHDRILTRNSCTYAPATTQALSDDLRRDTPWTTTTSHVLLTWGIALVAFPAGQLSDVQRRVLRRINFDERSRLSRVVPLRTRHQQYLKPRPGMRGKDSLWSCFSAQWLRHPYLTLGWQAGPDSELREVRE